MYIIRDNDGTEIKIDSNSFEISGGGDAVFYKNTMEDGGNDEPKIFRQRLVIAIAAGEWKSVIWEDATE